MNAPSTPRIGLDGDDIALAEHLAAATTLVEAIINALSPGTAQVVLARLAEHLDA